MCARWRLLTSSRRSERIHWLRTHSLFEMYKKLRMCMRRATRGGGMWCGDATSAERVSGKCEIFYEAEMRPDTLRVNIWCYPGPGRQNSRFANSIFESGKKRDNLKTNNLVFFNSRRPLNFAENSLHTITHVKKTNSIDVRKWNGHSVTVTEMYVLFDSTSGESTAGGGEVPTKFNEF